MMGTHLAAFKCILLLFTCLLEHVEAKPTVDPGLFMILGVETCRGGEGYCLLGLDCTLDDDFLPDDSGGHCDGLKKAFTPSAHFTCCKVNPDRPMVATTKRPRPHLAQTSTTTIATPTNNSATPLIPAADTVSINATMSPTTDPESIKASVVEVDGAFHKTENVIDAVTADVTTKQTSAALLSTSTSAWTESDVFVDVNNEVFKEVVPPALQQQEMEALVQTDDNR